MMMYSMEGHDYTSFMQWQGIIRRALCGHNSVWFTLPPTIMAFVDLWITLHYQPTEFWRGNTEVAIEGNPLALIALRIDPLVLLACVVVWCAGVAFFVMRLPRGWALDLAMFLVCGHAFCIGQWIVMYDERWRVKLALLAGFVAMLVIPLVIARRSHKKTRRPDGTA